MSACAKISLHLLLGGGGTAEIDLTAENAASAQRVIDALTPLCVDMALTDCAGIDPEAVKLPFHDLP